MNVPRALGALVVPALAIAYAVYAWWEQNEGAYREDTTQYMLVLIAPVLVLASIVILQSGYEAWREGRRAAPGGSAEEPDAAPDPGRYLRPLLLAAASIVLVATVEVLGHLVAFTLFVVAVLLAMGVRSSARIAAVTLGTMIVVHVVFIEILDQPLPRGLLARFGE